MTPNQFQSDHTLHWPAYEPTSLKDFRKHIGVTAHVLTDLSIVRCVLRTISLVTVYIVGTLIPMPWADPTPLQHLIQQSWFLDAFDQVAAGGALSHVSAFSLGILPLMVVTLGSARVRGRTLLLQTRMSRRSTALAFLMVVVASAGFVLGGVTPLTLAHMTVTMLSLLIGSSILLVIDDALVRNGGPDVLAINLLLIGIRYTSRLVARQDLIGVIIILAMVAFVIQLMWLLRQCRKVRVVNIRRWPVEGELSLPVTSPLGLTLLLVCIWIISAAIQGLALVVMSLGPFQSSVIWVEVGAIFCAYWLVVAPLLRRVALESIAFQFQPDFMARIMQGRFWVVPGVDAGSQTTAFLTTTMHGAFRVNYVFMGVWLTAFALLSLTTWTLERGDLAPPFGPVGLLLILGACGENLMAAVQSVRHHFALLTWPTRSAVSGRRDTGVEVSLGPIDLAELVQHAVARSQPQLPARPGPMLTGEDLTPRDLASLIVAAAKAQAKPRASEAGRRIVVKTLTSTVSTLLVLGFSVYVLNVVIGATFDAPLLSNVVFFVIPLWLTLFFGLETHRDIADLVRGLRRHGRLPDVDS